MSTRAINATVLTAFSDPRVRGIVFVWLDWTTGVVAAHDQVGKYSLGGVDYLGVGSIGKVDVVKDSIGRAVECIVSMTGVDPALVATAQLSEQYGRAAKIHVGALDEDLKLIGAETQFVGKITRATLKLNEGTAEISVRLISRADLLNRTTNARVTAEDQRARHPGDTFLDFLPDLQTRTVTWGGQHKSGGGAPPRTPPGERGAIP